MIDTLLEETLADASSTPSSTWPPNLPIRMLDRILGCRRRRRQLFEWADQIVYHADPDYSAAVVDASTPTPIGCCRSAARSAHSVRPLRAHHRRPPSASGWRLISLLADAVVDGAPLTERERGAFFLLLLIAGNETTRHSLSRALIAFAERPDEFERLRADPELLNPRWKRCCAGRARRCTSAALRQPTHKSAANRSAGDKVVTWYVAANFDPAQFAEPHRFDIGRSPNRHVTFGGGGPHLCLGQWMARLEVRVFLQALISASAIELAGPSSRAQQLHQRHQAASDRLAGTLTMHPHKPFA